MRKTIIAIVTCIIVLLLGYSGYRGYKVWKQNHWITMAKRYALKGDVRNESLSLQQILRINPQNVEACQMMADLTDAMHSPAAMVWRQRLLEMDPNSLDKQLAVAKTAMSFNNFLLASNTLAGVSDNDKHSAPFQNLAGVLATGLNHWSEAEKHFAEAVRLAPDNLSFQMNLATMRLHGSNSLDQAEARIEMKRMTMIKTNEAVRSLAFRELILDAIDSHDLKTAEVLSHDLVQQTNALFSDRLLRLGVLQRAKSSQFKSFLSSCEQEATTVPGKLSQMADWLMKQVSPAEALTWMQGLPMETQTNQPAALIIAQCQLDTHNWHTLQATLQNQNWNELEFVRHAFLARSLREQGLQGASTAEWGVALKYASDHKSSLIGIFRVAAEWHWTSEAEQVLWVVVNRYPMEKWAAPLLTQALMTEGRTRPLMELFDTLSKRSPDDIETKNNLAFTALLLGAHELNPNGIAQEVYDKDPQNPSFASTYALSLYLQKKYDQALKVMQKLTPKQLEDPAVAGYYGLILKATGDASQAKSYMALAAKGHLLPEERTLFGFNPNK